METLSLPGEPSLHNRRRDGRVPQGSGRIAVCLLLTAAFLCAAGAQTHFAYQSHTGNNGTIVIPLSCHPTVGDTILADGDEIGVFSPTGVCAGAGTWMGTNLAITVWGDDEQTPAIDGMGIGERMSFRVWSQNHDSEYVNVQATFALGNGLYTVNGIYSLNSMKVSLVGVDEPAGLPSGAHLYQNYPNPWNPTTTIAFSLSEESDVSLRMFNTLGEEVLSLARGTYPAGAHELQVGSDGLASGCYFYRLEAYPIRRSGIPTVRTRSLLLLR